MNIALIFAGGTGRRMHSKDLPKQFLSVHGKPIIIHTLEHFEKHSDIDAIVVVCHQDWIEYCERIVAEFGINKVCAVIPGGKTGQVSIRNGLSEIKKRFGDDPVVLIHDGVRPLINENVISENIKCVNENGNAITTGSVVETVIKIDENEQVDKVYNRDLCRLARAPQGFYLRDIWAAHQRLVADGDPEVIDSAMLMAKYGATLHTVEGPIENIKVTTPMDFYLLQAYMQAREMAQFSQL